MKKILIAIILLTTTILSYAQVGEYRNVFSLGVGGGYALNTVGFQPKVLQDMHGGLSIGARGRYTCEKYFTMLCAVQVEANITQLGWRERIETIGGSKVINAETGVAEEYRRDQTYLQIPFFAHLSWGRERKGVNAFINLGPQIGFALSEKTVKNYSTPYIASNDVNARASTIVKQEDMPIENKFDYGIIVGAGVEFHINKVGRFDIEGRYYYGLGNIYGDSKKDYFGISNNSTIFINLSYLCDL